MASLRKEEIAAAEQQRFDFLELADIEKRVLQERISATDTTEEQKKEYERQLVYLDTQVATLDAAVAESKSISALMDEMNAEVDFQLDAERRRVGMYQRLVDTYGIVGGDLGQVNVLMGMQIDLAAKEREKILGMQKEAQSVVDDQRAAIGEAKKAEGDSVEALEKEKNVYAKRLRAVEAESKSISALMDEMNAEVDFQLDAERRRVGMYQRLVDTYGIVYI